MSEKAGMRSRFIALLLSAVLLSIPVSAEAGWEFQESGVTAELNDVCFIDELHGWAVGYYSTIIATTDGSRKCSS